MCMNLDLIRKNKPIMSRQFVNIRSKYYWLSDLQIFGQKTFTITSYNNKILLSGWSKNIIYNITDNSDFGLILSSPQVEQSVGMDYELQLKDNIVKINKEVRVKDLGMHFTIEADNNILNYTKVNNYITLSLIKIQDLSIKRANDYRVINLPVFTFNRHIQMFGDNGDAIASEVIIPNSAVFKAYLMDFDKPDQGFIDNIILKYTELYNRLIEISKNNNDYLMFA